MRVVGLAVRDVMDRVKLGYGYRHYQSLLLLLAPWSPIGGTGSGR